jgi:hypothetical protein
MSRGGRGGIEHFRFSEDRIAEVRAERRACVQVDASADQRRQLVREVDESKPQYMTWLKFDQHVKVAVWAEVTGT